MYLPRILLFLSLLDASFSVFRSLYQIHLLALCLELLVLVPLGQTRFEAIVLGAAFVDHLDATVLAALFKCRHFGDALLFLRTVPHDFGYQDL